MLRSMCRSLVGKASRAVRSASVRFAANRSPSRPSARTSARCRLAPFYTARARAVQSLLERAGCVTSMKRATAALAIGALGRRVARPRKLRRRGRPTTGTARSPIRSSTTSSPIPDLIRVGDDFYLTGTTMHAMPGLPVLHSRDLVNWEFMSYALDKLDLGPQYRLEDGKEIYGKGIWAPSFRYHNGTFHIFSNVNGQTTQHFTATSPRGPWTRTPMKKLAPRPLGAVRRRRQGVRRVGLPGHPPRAARQHAHRHRAGHRARALREGRRHGRGLALLQDRREVLHHERVVRRDACDSPRRAPIASKDRTR